MPETLDDIVEDLADKLGIYGPFPVGDHPADCKCRICFTIEMKDRVEAAAELEIKDRILKDERRRISDYLKAKYGDVGKGASRTALYRIAKDLAIDLVLR